MKVLTLLTIIHCHGVFGNPDIENRQKSFNISCVKFMQNLILYACSKVCVIG